MPKLSIVIPCYNSEPFISKTLEMLFEQDIKDCEIICINDGSTDNTYEILKKFENSIILINKKNEGVSKARNDGIKAAKGEYVYFLDSDDCITKDTILFFKKSIDEKQNVDFFAFGYQTEKNGTVLKKYCFNDFNNRLMTKSDVTEAFLTKKLCFHICSCLFKKKFLDENKILFTENVKIGEDIEFIMKVLNKLNNCYYESRLSFLYQIRDNSAMQGFKTYSMNRFNSFLLFQDFFEKNQFGTEKDRNFFIANYYVSQLIAYLNDKKFNDDYVNNKFKENFYVLKKTMSGSFKRRGVIKFINFWGIKVLFILGGKK